MYDDIKFLITEITISEIVLTFQDGTVIEKKDLHKTTIFEILSDITNIPSKNRLIKLNIKSEKGVYYESGGIELELCNNLVHNCEIIKNIEQYIDSVFWEINRLRKPISCYKDVNYDDIELAHDMIFEKPLRDARKILFLADTQLRLFDSLKGKIKKY